MYQSTCKIIISTCFMLIYECYYPCSTNIGYSGVMIECWHVPPSHVINEHVNTWWTRELLPARVSCCAALLLPFVNWLSLIVICYTVFYFQGLHCVQHFAIHSLSAKFYSYAKLMKQKMQNSLIVAHSNVINICQSKLISTS